MRSSSRARPGAQTHQLIRLAAPDAALPPHCEARPVGLEELALAYLRETAAVARAGPVGATR